jgi:hypothetical protein
LLDAMRMAQYVPTLQAVPLRATLIIEDDELTVGYEVMVDRTDLIQQLRKEAAHITAIAGFQPDDVTTLRDEDAKAIVLELVDPTMSREKLARRGQHQVLVADVGPGYVVERHGIE